MSIKSLNTLLQELRTFLRAYNDGVDTSDNSLIKDIILRPYMIGGEGILDQVEIARNLHILSDLEGGDLDNEGTNYKKERLSGAYATVVLTFYANVKPTSDIVISANSQGSTAGTAFVSPISFSTFAEARFSTSDIDSYYSDDRDRYEFPVTAICTEIGLAGNNASGTIVNINSNISGIDGVTNLTASTGGLDEEIDDDIRTRIQLAKLGRDLNTVNGLKSFLKDVGFIDSYPVRAENPQSERQGIDVFVVTPSTAVAVDTFTYDPSVNRYYLTKRPALEITSVVGSNKGTLGNSDFDGNIDNSSSIRRSIYAMDYIHIRASAGLIVGEQITVTYNYSPLIINTQSSLNENDNDILTADPLLKRAYPLYLYISAKLALKANADGATVRSTCKNAIAQYAANYRLGGDLQKSDLVVVLQNGYGDYSITMVDAVVINDYYLKGESGTIYMPVNEVIDVNEKSFVQYGSATIV